MSVLQTTIEQEIKTSLKMRENPHAAMTVDVLRMLLAAIKNAQIEKRHELSEDEVLSVVKKAVKERDDAIAMYIKAGREELAKKESEEKQILLTYLPEELSQEEISKIVKAVIEEKGVVQMSDFGNIMKATLEKAREYKGKMVDGAKVSQIIKERLNAQ